MHNYIGGKATIIFSSFLDKFIEDLPHLLGTLVEAWLIFLARGG